MNICIMYVSISIYLFIYITVNLSIYIPCMDSEHTMLNGSNANVKATNNFLVIRPVLFL